MRVLDPTTLICSRGAGLHKHAQALQIAILDPTISTWFALRKARPTTVSHRVRGGGIALRPQRLAA